MKLDVAQSTLSGRSKRKSMVRNQFESLRTLMAAAASLALLAHAAPSLSQVSQAPQVAQSTWPNITDTARGGRRFVTVHQGQFNGRKVRYRATVEETILMDAAGKPASSMFTTSYVALNSQETARPVIFIYNGGPGGASSPLHIGAMGPMIMASFTVAAQADPKTPLVRNPDAILDAADLVFIDPPETGFGRALPGADPKTFRGIDADSYAVGQFIVHWLTENGRLDSPKFLAGESYGGHRTVALVRDLPRATPKVEIDGMILISPAPGYNGPNPGIIRHLPDPLRGVGRIEDAAAMAWYHGKIDNKGQTLAQAVEKARAFTRGEYATAMLLGNRLDEAGRRRIAQRLSELTGLSADYYLAHDLRIGDIRHDLLADRGLVLDQFDGRETAPAASLPAEDRARDWDAVFAGLTENMTAYAARDLGVKGIGPYRTIVQDPYGFEDTFQYFKPPADGIDRLLSDELKAEPRLRLLAPLGVFDTTGSLAGTDGLISQLGVPPERTTVVYYPGGHMVYADAAGRRSFNADIRAFVQRQPITARRLPDMAPGH